MFLATSVSAMVEKALGAIALLLAENRQISELFAKIGRLEVSSADTEVLVGDVCRALTIQAQLLQEIAYPALRAAGVQSSILDQAEADQTAIRQLIEDLHDVPHTDVFFDARVKALAHRVQRRFRSDETELFPNAQWAPVDLVEIGRRLAARRAELTV